MGPGVTPVIQWEGPGLTSADRAAAASITAVFDESWPAMPAAPPSVKPSLNATSGGSTR